MRLHVQVCVMCITLRVHAGGVDAFADDGGNVFPSALLHNARVNRGFGHPPPDVAARIAALSAASKASYDAPDDVELAIAAAAVRAAHAKALISYHARSALLRQRRDSDARQTSMVDRMVSEILNPANGQRVRAIKVGANYTGQVLLACTLFSRDHHVCSRALFRRKGIMRTASFVGSSYVRLVLLRLATVVPVILGKPRHGLCGEAHSDALCAVDEYLTSQKCAFCEDVDAFLVSAAHSREKVCATCGYVDRDVNAAKNIAAAADALLLTGARPEYLSTEATTHAVAARARADGRDDDGGFRGAKKTGTCLGRDCRGFALICFL